MKKFRVFSVVLLLAFLLAGIYAQSNSGQDPPTQPGTDQQGMNQKHPMGRMNAQARERMKARAQEMKEKQQKMTEEMKKMDEALQPKIDAMIAATGEQKVNAMADVINELVKERKAMHEHMATMHKDMCDHMMPMDHMGGMHGAMMHDMGTTGTMGMMSGPMGDTEEKK